MSSFIFLILILIVIVIALKWGFSLLKRFILHRQVFKPHHDFPLIEVNFKDDQDEEQDQDQEQEG